MLIIRSIRNQAFTVIELIIVVAVLATLSVFAIVNFVNIQDDAYNGIIDKAEGAIKVGVYIRHQQWILAGAPAGNNNGIAVVDLPDIRMRFKNGWPFRAVGTGHVPAGVPNPTWNSTRLWYAILDNSSELIAAGSGTGWVAVSDGACPGNKRNLCWDYEVNGSPVVRLRYDANNLTFTRI